MGQLTVAFMWPILWRWRTATVWQPLRRLLWPHMLILSVSTLTCRKIVYWCAVLRSGMKTPARKSINIEPRATQSRAWFDGKDLIKRIAHDEALGDALA